MDVPPGSPQLEAGHLQLPGDLPRQTPTILMSHGGKGRWLIKIKPDREAHLAGLLDEGSTASKRAQGLPLLALGEAATTALLRWHGAHPPVCVLTLTVSPGRRSAASAAPHWAIVLSA
jgi:hypothetical protein